jgi:hypothetical protein
LRFQIKINPLLFAIESLYICEMRTLIFAILLCFILNSTAQTQIGADIDGTEAGDLSGISLCISRDGNTIAIGSNDSFGQVRVFKLASTVWSQMGADIVGDAHDYSGRSVSMASDGKTIAIS